MTIKQRNVLLRSRTREREIKKYCRLEFNSQGDHNKNTNFRQNHKLFFLISDKTINFVCLFYLFQTFHLAMYLQFRGDEVKSLTEMRPSNHEMLTEMNQNTLRNNVSSVPASHGEIQYRPVIKHGYFLTLFN